MGYEPDWVTLRGALARLTASGIEEIMGKSAVCGAISDRKIAVRVTTKRTEMRSAADLDPIELALSGKPVGGGEIFEGNSVFLPAHLGHADLDWVNSRPLKPWRVRPRNVHERYSATFDGGPWEIVSLELRREDVDGLRLTLVPRGIERASAKVERDVAPPLTATRGQRVADIQPVAQLKQDAEKEYKERVKWSPLPTIEQDLKWGRGRGLSRDRVRELRRRFRPASSRKGGRRNLAAKPGGKETGGTSA